MPIEKIAKKKVSADQKTPEELHDFYTAYYSNEVKIRFDKLKVLNLMRDLGFFWYLPPQAGESAKKGMLVQIRDNRIRVLDEINVQYAFKHYIQNLPTLEVKLKKKVIEDGESVMQEVPVTITPSFLETKMLDNLSNLFGGDMIYHLTPRITDKPIVIQDDTIDEKFIFFNNTALRVTKNGVERVPYKSLPDCIWENNIINRDFEYTEEVGEFETFVNHICGNDGNSQIKSGAARKKSLMSIMGYLMHNNYECDRKALIFTDINETDATEDNGRTGKGILGKALREIINRNVSDCRYLVVPGKDFEFKDTRYAGGDISTQLIHIEDVDSNRFDFEKLYGDITDGCVFRKLHHDAIIHNSKIMISTNKTIDLTGSESKLGRAVVFELENYYNATHTPSMEFGHLFFGSRWTDNDWQQFYSFMVRCAETYMKYGLIQPDMVNYMQRIIEENIPEDFIFYLGYHINTSVALKKRQELNKRTLYDGFVLKYPQFEKYSQNGFTKWCTKYLSLKKIPSAHVRTTKDKDYIDLFVIYPDSHERVYKWIYKKTGDVEETSADEELAF